ncbi:MAG: beta-N-acetylhexosaminidase [Bacteroidales bacterium]
MSRFRALTLPLLAILTLGACSGDPEPVSIIPLPAKIEVDRGTHTIRGALPIYYENDQPGLQGLAAYLSTIFESTGIRPVIHAGEAGERIRKGIVLIRDTSLSHHEEYHLVIDRKTIRITGGSPQGVFYGIQSLRQMLPPEIEDPELAVEIRRLDLPRLRIADFPAFDYRGMHLDVARHFFPVSFIKKYIDLMALHKMNQFHWHLTEDQGWRIEIMKYPLLTEVGSWRRETLTGHGGRSPFEYDGTPYGGYYTQEEIREVVAHAAERFINVIPEIEMPGHATAALASYPHLGCTGGPYEVITRWGVFHDVFCAGNEQVFEFLEDVLTEVAELFPSKFIHIGGDECPKTRWKECPACQARIREEGLADEYELQSYFIRRMEAFLLSMDRNIIGWDEILEGGLAPNATVMSWRGTEGGIAAARMGQNAIMTPGSHCYFDHYQADPETQPLAIGGLTTLKKVYAYDPVQDELSVEEAGYILGVQGNVWTEYIKTPAHVEYMAYPRAIALAEVGWSPEDSRDFQGFLERLKKHSKRLDAMNVNYFRGNLN